MFLLALTIYCLFVIGLVYTLGLRDFTYLFDFRAFVKNLIRKYL